MLSVLKRLTAVSAGGYIAYNAFLVAAQDDWDSVRYQLKKLTLLKVIEKTLVPPSYRYPKKVNKDRKKVVVLGSGWGAMSFLQQVDYDKVEVTIVSPRPYFFYTPLLTQTSTGTISHGSIKEPIRYLISEEGGGTYLQAELVGVDVKGKTIACKDVSGNAIDVKYDQLVVAVGTEVNTFNIEGVRENTIFMKELEDGIKVQRQILQNLEAANAAYLAGAPAEEVRFHIYKWWWW
jgi:NADH dehydrogenase FAD-containing subunit